MSAGLRPDSIPVLQSLCSWFVTAAKPLETMWLKGMHGHTAGELLKYHVMFKQPKLLKYPYACELGLLMHRFS